MQKKDDRVYNKTDYMEGKGKKESKRERSKQIHKNKTSPKFGLQCMQMQN